MSISTNPNPKNCSNLEDSFLHMQSEVHFNPHFPTNPSASGSFFIFKCKILYFRNWLKFKHHEKIDISLIEMEMIRGMGMN